MNEATHTGPRVAVLIPCYQEELTIAKVVGDFKRELPDAEIYVFDNNCTDRTAEVASRAGAIVRREKRQGKGFVVASMFDQVDADIYVMVDGDDTYDAGRVGALLEPILKGDADITVANRLSTLAADSFRGFHVLGNRVVSGIINWMFESNIRDVFSGFRAFTRSAARLVPITARGFDVETELTVQALYRGLVVREIDAPYRARPSGSYSKLKTGPDGLLVFLKLFLLVRSYKPLTFFGSVSVLLFVGGALVGAAPVYESLVHGFVYRLPRAVLAATLMLLSAGSLALGLVLNSVNVRLLEIERLIQRQRS